MAKTRNSKSPKNLKIKEIAIKKKLERELEEILDKQIITQNNNGNNGFYSTNRNSNIRKDKRE